MADRRYPTLAERFRTAREAFALGCQLGVTPARATEIAAENMARARWEAADRRLAARAAASPIPTFSEAAPRPRRWWED